MKQTAQQKLNEFNIKPSLHRIAVLQYLMDHYTHPDADLVFNALSPKIPTLSKTTVYNVLKLLAENGVVRCITIDEKMQRFDANISEHAHFKCKHCGKIIDLPILSKNIKVKNTQKLKIDGMDIFLYGSCPLCTPPRISKTVKTSKARKTSKPSK
jgi:Fur family ferric uptake transcriptional regulator/Fur family peroxide stress response transcriptional regulator